MLTCARETVLCGCPLRGGASYGLKMSDWAKEQIERVQSPQRKRQARKAYLLQRRQRIEAMCLRGYRSRWAWDRIDAASLRYDKTKPLEFRLYHEG